MPPRHCQYQGPRKPECLVGPAMLLEAAKECMRLRDMNRFELQSIIDNIYETPYTDEFETGTQPEDVFRRIVENCRAWLYAKKALLDLLDDEEDPIMQF